MCRRKKGKRTAQVVFFISTHTLLVISVKYIKQDVFPQTRHRKVKKTKNKFYISNDVI